MRRYERPGGRSKANAQVFGSAHHYRAPPWSVPGAGRLIRWHRHQPRRQSAGSDQLTAPTPASAFVPAEGLGHQCQRTVRGRHGQCGSQPRVRRGGVGGTTRSRSSTWPTNTVLGTHPLALSVSDLTSTRRQVPVRQPKWHSPVLTLRCWTRRRARDRRHGRFRRAPPPNTRMSPDGSVHRRHQWAIRRPARRDATRAQSDGRIGKSLAFAAEELKPRGNQAAARRAW